MLLPMQYDVVNACMTASLMAWHGVKAANKYKLQHYLKPFITVLESNVLQWSGF